jgi:heat-inducible transcriptional repressor
VSNASPSATVRSIQIVRIAQRAAIVVAVLSNSAVEKTTIDLGEDLSDEQVADASAFLAGRTIGRPLSDGFDDSEATETPATRHARHAFVSLVAGPEPDVEHVFVHGQSRMAAAFDAVEKVREVLSVLERQLVVVSLIRDVLSRGQNVSIGSETGVEPLNECSLVVAPFEVDGEEVGTIGVLGPTRLNYPQALSAVAVVSQRLGDRLSEG